MPPTRFAAGGEAEGFALVEWAERYGAAQPESFGGAWLDYVDEYPYAYASFVGDLEPHRAALDPRIRVVVADRSAAELSEVLKGVKVLAEGPLSARLSTSQVDAERGVVLVTVEADDEAAFERAVRERFGDVVDLYFDQYARVDTSYEDWSIDAAGTTITAEWIGGGFDREHGLDVVEDADAVHLTAWAITHVGYRRAAGGKGQGLSWGHTLEGYSREASVVLSRPLATRRVLDDRRDRIEDNPEVDRTSNPDAQFEASDFIDALDWAEWQGSEGFENGWVRILATVDDTARLEAALNERFGGGFEVVYKPRWQDELEADDDE